MNTNKLTKIFVIIFGILFLNNPVIASKNNTVLNDQKGLDYKSDVELPFTYVQNTIKDTNHFCVVVRYPVNAKKLSILKNRMKNSDLTEKNQIKSKELFNQTVKDNSDRFSLLYKSFETHFTEKPFFFLPDSSFKDFKINPSGLFINQYEVQDASLKCPYKNYYLIISGDDMDKLLFVTPELARAPDPLPYKKNIFLPAFKKIFNKPGYFATQVKYFNEELKKLHP